MNTRQTQGTRRLSVLCIALVLILCSARRLTAQSEPAYPNWWYTQGAINTSGTMNDFGAANLGQAKNFTLAAINELDTDLAQFGGAGPTLDGAAALLIANETNQIATLNDFAAVNLGQLKTLVQPIYDQLIAIGYTGPPLNSGTAAINGPYPWENPNAGPANDYAAANIGQLKYLFSFDPDYSATGDTIPDWWKNLYSLGPSTTSTSYVSWSVGLLTYFQLYQEGINPVDPFSGQTPILNKVSGDNQSSDPSVFLANPLIVKVSTASNATVANVPVFFSVEGSAGGLSTAQYGSGITSTVAVFTGADGTASAYFAPPSAASGPFYITVRTGAPPNTASTQFTATLNAVSGFPVAAPSDVIARFGGGGVFISWTDNDSGAATGYDVERSIDNQNWVVIATVQPGTYHYIDTNPPAGDLPYYRVGAKSSQ